MTEQKCTCQKVPELNYVSSDPDCPVHYAKIDQEKKWIKEFEEWLKGYKQRYQDTLYIYGWTLADIKNTWLESRRKFIAQLKKDAKLVGFNVNEWEEKEVKG